MLEDIIFKTDLLFNINLLKEIPKLRQKKNHL